MRRLGAGSGARVRIAGVVYPLGGGTVKWTFRSSVGDRHRGEVRGSTLRREMQCCLSAHVRLQRGEELAVDWFIARSPRDLFVSGKECVVGSVLLEREGLLPVGGGHLCSGGVRGVRDEELSVES